MGSVEQQVEAGGLLQLLDGVGGRIQIGAGDDRAVVGQQEGVVVAGGVLGERLERRVAGGVVGQLR